MITWILGGKEYYRIIYCFLTTLTNYALSDNRQVFSLTFHQGDVNHLRQILSILCKVTGNSPSWVTVWWELLCSQTTLTRLVEWPEKSEEAPWNLIKFEYSYNLLSWLKLSHIITSMWNPNLAVKIRKWGQIVHTISWNLNLAKTSWRLRIHDVWRLIFFWFYNMKSTTLKFVQIRILWLVEHIYLL